MTYLPLTRSPWRRQAPSAATLPHPWVHPQALVERIDAWRGWLAGQPAGDWLLYQRQPTEFLAALLALWESGRVAVLPGDDRPDTLARLAGSVAGRLPERPPQRVDSAPPPVTLDPAAIAVVLTTSGSTGEPVRLTKRFDQLDAELAAHARLWPLTGAGVISQVSHQHIYGLLTGVLHPLCAGAPLCGDDCRYPEVLAARLADTADAGLAPVVVSSPAQLSRLPTHLAWDACPAPRRIFSSGAPLSGEHARHAERLLNAPVIEIYGSTETGGIAHRRQAEGAEWQPLPGVELSLADERLSLRSAFLESPERWWQQADRVTPTAQGFALLGRADRVVKIAGKRVSLDGLERTLALAPHVRAVRCVDLARSDGRLGVVVALDDEAIPQHHDARRALIQRLRGCLSAGVESVAIPRYWRFVAALPSNAQGKLDRGLIQRLFADLDDPRAPRWLGEQRPDSTTSHHTLEVPERLAFLDGHFDAYPLVPGVVMVQWAIELARDSFGKLGDFQGIERLKFQRMLRPGIRFSLHLTRHTERVAFTIDSHEGRHCTGNVRLQVPTRKSHG